MFFLAAACTIRRTQLKLHSIHTEWQWLLSVISPVVWLMGIKLCRTLLANKVKSNKSRKKTAASWKLVCGISAVVHYLQLGKRSLPPLPPLSDSHRQMSGSPCPSGFCFPSSWPQQSVPVHLLRFPAGCSDCSEHGPSEGSGELQPKVILKPNVPLFVQALSVPSLPKARHCSSLRQPAGERWQPEKRGGTGRGSPSALLQQRVLPQSLLSPLLLLRIGTWCPWVPQPAQLSWGRGSTHVLSGTARGTWSLQTPISWLMHYREQNIRHAVPAKSFMRKCVVSD